MYADAYLAQTDGAYSAACGRRVPSRQKPQAPSMTSGLLRRTGSRPCSRPAGSLSILFFGGVRGGGLPGGGEPSALRWMAAKAEFPCGLPGGGGHQRCAGWLRGLNFLVVCWEVVSHQWCGGWLQGLSFLVICREGVWHRRCGGCSGGLAVFVEGFLLTFAGGVVILKIHIWEHSGPFGYLIPIWLVV